MGANKVAPKSLTVVGCSFQSSLVKYISNINVRSKSSERLLWVVKWRLMTYNSIAMDS